MEREDHERLADGLEQEGDRLERENKRLDEEINDVRQDWEAKRQDPGVPGAPPRPESESDPPAGSESESVRPEVEED